MWQSYPVKKIGCMLKVQPGLGVCMICIKLAWNMSVLTDIYFPPQHVSVSGSNCLSVSRLGAIVFVTLVVVLERYWISVIV